VVRSPPEFLRPGCNPTKHPASRLFSRIEACRFIATVLADRVWFEEVELDLQLHLVRPAATIRRMFDLYAKGQSLKRLAHLLNKEGVRSPQPQKGRVSRSWCVSSVRHILRNRRCAGQIIWNTKRKVRVPGTGEECIGTGRSRSGLLDSDEQLSAVGRRFQTTQKLWARA
jgi:hypothetical protein